jgi:hypothetical protein
MDFTAADVHRQTDVRTSDLLALLLEVLKQFDDKLLQVFPGFACQLADNRRALQTQEAASVHSTQATLGVGEDLLCRVFCIIPDPKQFPQPAAQA